MQKEVQAAGAKQEPSWVTRQLLSGLPLWASADQSQGQELPLWPHGAQTCSALQSCTPCSLA